MSHLASKTWLLSRYTTSSWTLQPLKCKTRISIISTLNRQHIKKGMKQHNLPPSMPHLNKTENMGQLCTLVGLDCFQRKSSVVNLCLRRLPAILQYLELSQWGSWSACTPGRELHFFSGTEPQCFLTHHEFHQFLACLWVCKSQRSGCKSA